MLTGPVNREFVVAGPVDRVWTGLAAGARAELAVVRIPPSGGAPSDGPPDPGRGCELRLRFIEEDATALSLRCIFGGSAGLRRMQADCDISLRAEGGDRTAIVVSMRMRDSSRDADEAAQALIGDVLKNLARVAHRSAQQPDEVGPGRCSTRASSAPGRAATPAGGASPVHRVDSRAVAFLLAYVVTRELLRWRSR